LLTIVLRLVVFKSRQYFLFTVKKYVDLLFWISQDLPTYLCQWTTTYQTSVSRKIAGKATKTIAN